MYFKVLVLAATIAVAAAQHGYNNGYGSHGLVQPVVAHQPVVVQHQPQYASAVQQDYNAPAHYSFNYGVQDPHTGDFKSQHESREGDLVRGEYSLHEADGTVRRVEYSVDPHSGFNAVVHREGQSSHQAPNYH